MRKTNICPIQATGKLNVLLRSLPLNRGRSIHSVYRESGIDLSKYKSGGSSPLVISLFKFGCCLEIEPSWLMALASKSCRGEVEERQVEKILTQWQEFSNGMDTAFQIVVKKLIEKP